MSDVDEGCRWVMSMSDVDEWCRWVIYEWKIIHLKDFHAFILNEFIIIIISLSFQYHFNIISISFHYHFIIISLSFHYHFISFHIISYHMILFHIISYHDLCSKKIWPPLKIFLKSSTPPWFCKQGVRFGPQRLTLELLLQNTQTQVSEN